MACSFAGKSFFLFPPSFDGWTATWFSPRRCPLDTFRSREVWTLSTRLPQNEGSQLWTTYFYVHRRQSLTLVEVLVLERFKLELEIWWNGPLLLLDSSFEFNLKSTQLKKCFSGISKFFGIWRSVPGNRKVPGRIRSVFKWKYFVKFPFRMSIPETKEESVDPVLRHKCGYEVPPGTDLLSRSRTVWNPQKCVRIWLFLHTS